MPKVRTFLIISALALALTGFGLAALSIDSGEAANPPKVIYMSAVEYKGGTSSEPFPSATPPPGGGYLIKPPDGTGRWETSTYRFEPGTIVVDQGDEVELWIWGVNGAQHPSTIEGYVPEFTVTRGNLTILKFTADQEGIFRITCHTHQPSMEAQLVVMGPEAQAQVTPTQVPPTAAPATAAPAQLPETGGTPGDNGLPTATVGLALAALAGAALLVARLRRKAE